MKKIFVDLGGEIVVGILRNYGVEGKPCWHLDAIQGESLDDGAISPPQHVAVTHEGLKNLYNALKAIYEPTVVG